MISFLLIILDYPSPMEEMLMEAEDFPGESTFYASSGRGFEFDIVHLGVHKEINAALLSFKIQFLRVSTEEKLSFFR